MQPSPLPCCDENSIYSNPKLHKLLAALDNVMLVNKRIHRRAHKILWSFVLNFSTRKAFLAYKVEFSFALNCLPQLAFQQSPSDIVMFFPAFSARSSSIFCLTLFTMFPPLNERHEKNICMETLESDTIRAVKLLWSSFSSPSPKQFHQRFHQLRAQTTENLYLLSSSSLRQILQYFQSWCIVHEIVDK